MSGVLHGVVASLKAAAAAATDSFFKYVTLLLHGDGTNGAQNNTFLDGSTNNFTITRNGNTTQGSFSPFSQTGWSNYFDGTGDYLTTASSGTTAGDFTYEAWIYQTVSATAIVLTNGSEVANRIYMYVTSGQVLGWGVYAVADYNLGGSVPLNQWNHIAIVRSGSTVTGYVNGVAAGTTTTYSGTAGNANGFAVGANKAGTSPFTGYISNARVVNGTAVYTSAFTPPTAPLTAITNTSLLTCQSNRFIDNSSNAFAITRNGDVRVEAFSPFNPSTTYSTANVGGSGYFDGTGDFLSLSDNAALEPGSSDLTWEMWINTTASNQYATIYGRGTTWASGAWLLLINNASATAGDVAVWFNNFNTGAPLLASTGVNVRDAAWHHIAVVRNGSAWTLYVDGVSRSTATWAGTVADIASGPNIGRDAAFTARDFPGYISNLRIVKGTAVYTSAFTPPTAPLTAITNTSLLCNFTNGGVFDNASQTVLETVGNAQVSTTQKKYGTGSMYFDGTDDRLVMPARPPMAVGSGNFTIEGWVYRLDTNTRGVFQLSGTAGGLQANTTTNLALGSDAGSVWRIYANNSAYNSTATWAINTWYHFALVRNSGTTTLYIDGTSVISQADTVNYTGQNLCIGGFYNTTFLMNGYIDDLRITNGYARYTANFTAPTAAFPDN